MSLMLYIFIFRYPFKRLNNKQRTGHNKPDIETFAFGSPFNKIKNGRNGGQYFIKGLFSGTFIKSILTFSKPLFVLI